MRTTWLSVALARGSASPRCPRNALPQVSASVAKLSFPSSDRNSAGLHLAARRTALTAAGALDRVHAMRVRVQVVLDPGPLDEVPEHALGQPEVPGMPQRAYRCRTSGSSTAATLLVAGKSEESSMIDMDS